MSVSRNPLKWMKFDPEVVGLETDHLSMAERGAYFTLIRHLWVNGPMEPARLRTILRSHADVIMECLSPYGKGFSMQWIEQSREIGSKVSDTQSERAVKGWEKRRAQSMPGHAGAYRGNADKKESKKKIEKEKEKREEKKTSPNGEEPSAYGDPVINELMTYFKEKLGHGLDGSEKSNRWAVARLLKALEKDYPGYDQTVNAKALVDAALIDPFHAKNSTNFDYLARHMQAIARASKDRKSQTKNMTNDEYARAAAEVAARKWATDYPR